ncbi:hypothetical protein [Pseudoleptotrichia goodfellowii]|uniref:Uncharacterized protein n=1 Tax=Pseudoleptotrichia goodfellowii F0264 TaxID=596323 RepID=D0GKS4_9FUSO|nr:hypothetical protein [Pseudoleptotrichia goodfellowii]EEY35314.1 hypothetical protein HMPREF0554_2193 [Pseudoleptotrichia goodfellowii F0264]
MKEILKNKYLIKIFIGIFLLKMTVWNMILWNMILVDWFILKDIIKNILIFITFFLIKEDKEFKRTVVVIKVICNLILFCKILELIMASSAM